MANTTNTHTTGMCGDTKRDKTTQHNTRQHKARQTQHFKTPPRAPLDKKCVERAAAMCVCICHVCVSCVCAVGALRRHNPQRQWSHEAHAVASGPLTKSSKTQDGPHSAQHTPAMSPLMCPLTHPLLAHQLAACAGQKAETGTHRQRAQQHEA